MPKIIFFIFLMYYVTILFFSVIGLYLFLPLINNFGYSKSLQNPINNHKSLGSSCDNGFKF